jgi:hypothetical protein
MAGLDPAKTIPESRFSADFVTSRPGQLPPTIPADYAQRSTVARAYPASEKRHNSVISKDIGKTGSDGYGGERPAALMAANETICKTYLMSI